MSGCAIDGCTRPVRARGLCVTDYNRARRHGELNLLTVHDRFWSKVTKTDECWLWTGARGPRGYGHLRQDGRVVIAHRLAWELANGPIPGGVFVLHRCDNPPCVRADHLFLGDATVNMRDMADKGRGAHQRLTPAVVAELRVRYHADGVFLRELGAEFGVSEAAVSMAVRGITFPFTTEAA